MGKKMKLFKIIKQNLIAFILMLIFSAWVIIKLMEEIK